MSSTWSAERLTIPGLTVNSDLSSWQYKPVKFGSTADTVIAVSASTDTAVGVLFDAPDAAGMPATVIYAGITPMIAGTSAITAGQLVGFDSTGRIDPAHAAKIGRALEDAGAIGDHVQVMLTGLGA